MGKHPTVTSVKPRTSQHASESYALAKRGYRDDLPGIFFRSRWEANFARYLEFLRLRGEIETWEHEPETFWFEKIRRGVRSYTPDFRVTEKGLTYFIEVKGYMDAKSATKLKRMRIYHPGVRVDVVDRRTYRDLESKLGRVIPNWESGQPDLGTAY